MKRGLLDKPRKHGWFCWALGLTLVWGHAEMDAAEKAAATSNWPGFRGPGGAGVSAHGDFPVHFGPGSNVVWKVNLPGGHSSPCIWGSRIFLTGYENEKLVTLCLDRDSGQEVWRGMLQPANIEGGARWSSPATSTPVLDDEHVYVYFGAFGLACYTHAGKEVWRQPLPTPVTQHGASTSPVLAGDRLILASDQDVDSFLMAVDKRTGKTLWKTDRPGFRRGFSTPILWPPEAPQSVVLAGTLRLVAYGLDDGLEQWSVHGLPNEMVASPVTGEGMIFVAGWTYGSGVRTMPSYDSLLQRGDKDGNGSLTREEAPSGPAKQHFVYIDADKDGEVTRSEWDTISEIFTKSENALLAVRPQGKGDITDDQVMWKQTRGLPYVPSPLYYQGKLYLVKNGGLASCYDARTGEVHYQQERLGALGDYYSSPVAANGKICMASRQGVLVVFEAGSKLEVMARNDLDEAVLASPAIFGKRLYVRTQNHLYAFGE